MNKVEQNKDNLFEIARLYSLRSNIKYSKIPSRESFKDVYEYNQFYTEFEKLKLNNLNKNIDELIKVFAEDLIR